MNIFLIIIMVIANFILQSTILPSFSILGVVPNTALIFIVIISLSKGKYYGGLVGLAIGLIQDVIFAITIGVSGFIYFFIGYIIGSLENTMARDNIIIPVICSSLGTIFYNIMYFFFMFFLSREIPFTVIIKDILLIEIAYNIVFTIIIYKVIGKMFNEPSLRFGKR